jgi:poly-beta-1,6-N-acetyl-D-glucosamine biosynthesis protein PgaD
MSGSVIINARHRLAWYQRLISDVSTALMWGVWLWLWSPALRSFAWLADLGARSIPALMAQLAVAPTGDLHHSVVAFAGASGTLLVWNRLPARKICAPAAELSLREHARHFHLPEHELVAGRRATVCVVHHDEAGRIVRLESREPTTCSEAMAA